MDRPPAPLFPSDLWAPAKGISSRIPRRPPPRRRHQLEPIRWVRRELVSPRGQVVEALVPVYPPPTLDTLLAEPPRRYGTRRRAE